MTAGFVMVRTESHHLVRRGAVFVRTATAGQAHPIAEPGLSFPAGYRIQEPSPVRPNLSVGKAVRNLYRSGRLPGERQYRQRTEPCRGWPLLPLHRPRTFAEW